MSKESAAERIERLKRETEDSKKKKKDGSDIVSQLTHESTGTPDFAALARKLEERKAEEHKGENESHVKMTIYVQSDLAAAFNALCTKHGDQKRYTNQAIAEFVARKARELNI